MLAKFPGVCSCGRSIIPGEDDVVKAGEHWVHSSCATGVTESNTGADHWPDRQEHEQPSYRIAGKRRASLCPECFTEHRGECM